MNPYIILAGIIVYFGILFIIARITSRGANNDSFFIGNHKSPWYLVAFGMIGTSISGVTFVSVPGMVMNNSFSYLQFIMGNLAGYIIIATVLLPMYYKLRATSIYTYLEHRFGKHTYKTGAIFFLVSRTIGSSARLFLAASVLQYCMFDAWNIPFSVTVFITLAFIWLYTYKGGIKTIIYTDTLQTVFFILSLGITVYIISSELNLSFSSVVKTISDHPYSQIFFFDNFSTNTNHFFKHFFSGMLICIAMTGLDQDLMQKNLSCKNIKDAQKNMFTFSGIMFLVNFLFLSLGVMLYIFASNKGIALPMSEGKIISDQVFPSLAMGGHLPMLVAILFLLGLIASTCASSDSALTALTTSFIIDIVGTKDKSEKQLEKTRHITHLGFSALFLIVVLLFYAFNNKSIIDAIFTIASYTYGPLLGMYIFGFATKIQIRDKAMPYIAIAAPILSYGITILFKQAWGYKFGYEILAVNALITIIGMVLTIKKENK